MTGARIDEEGVGCAGWQGPERERPVLAHGNRLGDVAPARVAARETYRGTGRADRLDGHATADAPAERRVQPGRRLSDPVFIGRGRRIIARETRRRRGRGVARGPAVPLRRSAVDSKQ